MELKLGLLADFANKSADGKLNILGVFDRIHAQRFPAVHPEMKLVLRLEAHPAEIGETKKIKIQLRTEDGGLVLELEGELRLGGRSPSQLPLGELVHVDQILGINGFPIPAPGRYEFVVLVNGEVKGEIPFTAAILPGRAELPEEAGESTE